MTLGETMLFYLAIGLAVAVAQYASDRSVRQIGQLANSLAAGVFWPLYLPLLLSNRSPASNPPSAPAPQGDAMSAAIGQVERELDAALSSLDGWAENVVQHKPGQLNELRTALSAQADRIRQMNALVERERATQTSPPIAIDATLTGELQNDRWQRSEQARHDNIARLADVCRQSRTDLMATLAWIRELVSMIHLAKYTGAPAARAEELVAQIAAAVESISSLSSHKSAAIKPIRPAGNPPINSFVPPIITQELIP